MVPESIDEILVADDSAYDRFVTARLPRVRQELLDEHGRLEALLPSLTSDTIDLHPDRLSTAQRIAEIEAEIEASIVEIRLRGVGRRAWQDLLAQHPPTRDQKREFRDLDHNPETFPYEAIALCAVRPALTADQVRQLERKSWFNERCWQELWGACIRANVVDAAPKSLAAGAILRASGASGKRPTTTASPAQSSSDA